MNYLITEKDTMYVLYVFAKTLIYVYAQPVPVSLRFSYKYIDLLYFLETKKNNNLAKKQIMHMTIIIKRNFERFSFLYK